MFATIGTMSERSLEKRHPDLGHLFELGHSLESQFDSEPGLGAEMERSFLGSR